ncbi:MAG: hypothetical protein IT303_17930 [Dehalococcoidia bacterium]|nr:hypothetical protein [Dehalococcoidia bacterium]
MELAGARIAANWTSAAGALEGILAYVGAPLPRHAVMGLTGHAWHFCLGTKEGVAALPSGPAAVDRAALPHRYARTGQRWERFAARAAGPDELAAARAGAAAWAKGHLDAGRPLIGWDLHLHEHGVIYGYDDARGGLLADDILTPEVGPLVRWEDWAPLGEIELLAPVGAFEPDPDEVLAGALETAIACFEGRDGPEGDTQPRGADGIAAWADVLDGAGEVDRAGNAYTLAVLQAARLDGITFLEDLAGGIPELAGPLGGAARALREETKALAPLLTLFPFPTGGHGNVANPGLRRAAAMALRRAANHEREAAGRIGDGLEQLR